MAWFPQALLYGFWQSHLGKKRPQTKHARAWVSEIVGWKPAATDGKTLGVKGDLLNLTVEESVRFSEKDMLEWDLEQGSSKSKNRGKNDRLSHIGHGQVPFEKSKLPAATVSFERVSQRATVSFAQLRRISLGSGHGADADAAARALLVALGLHAHVLAFGRGFALRSGAELRPRATGAMWLGSEGDEPRSLGGPEATGVLLDQARTHADSAGVPLDGWSRPPVVLSPKENLRKAIRATWPELSD